MPKKETTIVVSAANPNKKSDNRIKNTKYTLFSFFPMMVKMQFESVLSIFFMFIIVCQMKKEYRITSLYSSVVPWLVIFFINLLREAIDNYSRYLRDKEINAAQYKKLKGTEFVKIESQNIKDGDIILIEKGQSVPADCILLKSEEHSGEIFIRTDQLDGETDWKRRNALAETQHCSLKSLQDIKVEIEKPSKEIYSFNGKLIIEDFVDNRDDNNIIFEKISSPVKIAKSVDLEKGTVFTPKNSPIEASPTVENIPSMPGRRELGCDLENTIWANTVVSSSAALALVIYTGHNTRSMMNTNKPRSKTGIIEKEMDKFVTIMAIISISSAVLFTICRCGFDITSKSWMIVCIRFIVIFSYVIPISLKFMITTARFIYVHQLSKDPNLSTVKVLTNTLQEELSRISFFLTDKTGTLTKNEMIMRKLHIGTICFNAENIEEIAKPINKILDKSLKHPKTFWMKSKSLESKTFDLMEALSVCHSVMPIVSGNEILYQASSPDEIAMVNYSEQIGLKLVARDNHSMIIRNPKGEVVYEIMYTFPFNSDTKRMGIILKKDNEYIFFEKGADTVMKNIIKENDWIEEETDNMAREGLRTLVIAKKTISKDEFSKFSKAYDKAKMSLVDRNEKMMVEQCKLEKNLEVIGLTGVEDKLQDKVKQTLESLRNAGIKIWMLTGDKVETAISIAFSSRLLTKNDHFMIISQCTSKEEIETYLTSLKTRGYNSLVIDGTSLAVIIEHCLDSFIEIAKNLHCLVGCRYSPTQKAVMAATLREKAKERVMCIGDGGNDVSMITEANVGVGIEGKEGSQASLAADFALKNFSDVAELMFCHGRRCYKNTSKIAHLIFHRGVLISTIQGIFCCLIYFFPISILQGNMPVLFIAFTIVPLFWIIIDKDIPNSLSMQYPELYKELQMNDLLSISQFFISLTMSIFQASTFIFIYFYFKDREMFSLSTICFTNLIINEQFMVLLTVSENLNPKIVLICLGSVLGYLLSIPLLSEIRKYDELFETGILLLLVNIAAIIPKIFSTIYNLYIKPSSHIKLSRQRLRQN